MWTSTKWSRTFFALTLILWVCVLLGSANASTPPVKHQNNTGRQQQQSASERSQNNRPALKPDPILSSFGKPSTGQEQQRATYAIWDPREWNPEWVIAVVTAVYAFFAWRQLGAIRKQAKISANALVLAQRPRLVIRQVVIGDPDLYKMTPQHYVGGQRYKGRLSIANIGGTPAHITQAACWVFAISSRSGELPMQRPYDGLFANATEKVSDYRLLPGQTATLLIDVDSETATAQTDPISDLQLERIGQTRLYVMGWIEYQDGLANKRVTAFCRFWYESYARFQITDDPDYEYSDDEPQVTRIV